MKRREYIAHLVQYGERLNREPAIDPAVLTNFREVVAPRATTWMARIEGTIARERRLLTAPHRNRLQLLSEGPGLLEPLRMGLAETHHTQALAWILSRERNGGLSDAPLDAVSSLLNRKLATAAGENSVIEDGYEVRLRRASVDAEPTFGEGGRMDLLLAAERWLVCIELKIGHVEGREQLKKYRAALKRRKLPQQTALLVLLAPDGWVSGAQEHSLSAVPDVIITYRELLSALIPIALSGSTPSHRWVSEYLRSVAFSICGLGESGPFEQWSWAAQRRAIEWVVEEG